MSKMLENLANAARDEILAEMNGSSIEPFFATESPIEEGLFFALLVHALVYPEIQVIPYNAPAELPHDMRLQTQKHIGNYRVDFCLSARPYHPDVFTGKQPWGAYANEVFLVVECDGHEFHERTPEQALRDRARDRDLQMQGYTVFRFTGREIYRNAWGCASQIFEWVEQTRWSLEPMSNGDKL